MGHDHDDDKALDENAKWRAACERAAATQAVNARARLDIAEGWTRVGVYKSSGGSADVLAKGDALILSVEGADGRHAHLQLSCADAQALAGALASAAATARQAPDVNRGFEFLFDGE